MLNNLLPAELQKRLEAMDEAQQEQYLARIINQAYELRRLFDDMPGKEEPDKEPDMLDEESEDMLLGGLDL